MMMVTSWWGGNLAKLGQLQELKWMGEGEQLENSFNSSYWM